MGECAITWGVDGVASEPTPKLVIKLIDSLGNPMQGYKVEGLTGVDETKCVTMEDGTVTLRNTWGTFTVSVPTTPWIDAEIPSTTIQISEGDSKEFILKPVSKSITSATIASSKNIIFSDLVKSVDVFCVGGGGGASGCLNDGITTGKGGAGGGGGYTSTLLNAKFTPEVSYEAIIGAGGAGGAYASPEDLTSGKDGGSTSFLSCIANGGKGSADYANAGDGGSGGGASSIAIDEHSGIAGSNGGSDGSDGERRSSSYSGTPGKGQGTTTRSFGESTGILCSPGGGGHGSFYRNNYSSCQNPGVAGEGTDYGKGGTGYSTSGGSGKSGVIMIRWSNKDIS